MLLPEDAKLIRNTCLLPATAGNGQGEFVVLTGDRLTGGEKIKFALKYLVYQSRKNNPQRQIEHRTAKFVFSTDNMFSLALFPF